MPFTVLEKPCIVDKPEPAKQFARKCSSWRVEWAYHKAEWLEYCWETMQLLYCWPARGVFSALSCVMFVFWATAIRQKYETNTGSVYSLIKHLLANSSCIHLVFILCSYLIHAKYGRALILITELVPTPKTLIEGVAGPVSPLQRFSYKYPWLYGRHLHPIKQRTVQQADCWGNPTFLQKLYNFFPHFCIYLTFHAATLIGKLCCLDSKSFV